MRLRLFALIVILLVATGIVNAQDESRLQIVASYSILADVIANVTGDAADVMSLIPIGADPHTFQPTPRDLAMLTDADVIFVNGAFFEEGLLEAIELAALDTPIIEASLCVTILPIGAASHSHDDHDDEAAAKRLSQDIPSRFVRALCDAHAAEMRALHGHDHDHDEAGATDGALALRVHDEEGEDHDHDHEHGHSHSAGLGRLFEIACEAHDHDDEMMGSVLRVHDDHDHHDHDHAEGDCDPHVWQEPHNVMYWVMHIRDVLVDLDPANAETYIANAQAYLEELDALAHDFIDARVAELPEDRRVLVTDHETFGYFAARHGFEVVGVILPGGGTDVQPSAAELAALIDVINDEGVPAIFVGSTVSSRLAEQIAAETGVTVYILYSDSLSEADGDAPTYIEMIRYNVNTIVDGLSAGM